MATKKRKKPLAKAAPKDAYPVEMTIRLPGGAMNILSEAATITGLDIPTVALALIGVTLAQRPRREGGAP